MALFVIFLKEQKFLTHLFVFCGKHLDMRNKFNMDLWVNHLFFCQISRWWGLTVEWEVIARGNQERSVQHHSWIQSWTSSGDRSFKANRVRLKISMYLFNLKESSNYVDNIVKDAFDIFPSCIKAPSVELCPKTFWEKSIKHISK